MRLRISKRGRVRLYVCYFQTMKNTVFEGRESVNDIINNDTMSDDEVVPYNVPPRSGVLIYKTVSDRLVIRDQPRGMGFMGKTAFTGSKFIYLSFFQSQKLFPLISSIF